MKIVFNFSRRTVGGRYAARAAALLRLTVLVCWSAAAVPARGEGVYFSTRDLLADFFRSSQGVTYQKFVLGPAEKARVARRLGYPPPRMSYTFFVASSQGHIDGYAIIDEERGEHLPITFAVKISAAGKVERQEIVAYREPRGDEVRDEHFRRQFVGKTVLDPVSVREDISVVSGATISSAAMAVGVRRALVLFDELVRPQAGATAQAAGRPPGTL